MELVREKDSRCTYLHRYLARVLLTTTAAEPHYSWNGSHPLPCFCADTAILAVLPKQLFLQTTFFNGFGPLVMPWHCSREPREGSIGYGLPKEKAEDSGHCVKHLPSSHLPRWGETQSGEGLPSSQRVKELLDWKLPVRNFKFGQWLSEEVILNHPSKFCCQICITSSYPATFLREQFPSSTSIKFNF